MIIGLTGYARSGKDTVAKILIEDYGYTRVAFADKIREFLYEINPRVWEDHYDLPLRDMVDCDGWDKAKEHPEVRRLLQDVGVSARKVFSESFWISLALQGVQPDSKVVITDVRFLNEAVRIQKYPGAQLWRIKRSTVAAVNNHVSESELDGYAVNQIIKNDGSIDDLKTLVASRFNAN